MKTAVRDNRPYDQFVRDIVSAKGLLYEKGNGLAGFKAREVMQLDRLANTVKSFLGMGIDCAQCHDHPFDDWTQVDFYQLAAYTSNVKLRVDPPPLATKVRKGQLEKLENKANIGPSVNAQERLAGWMTSPDNAMFAKATVNRLWNWVMDVELVGPLGGLSLEREGHTRN